MDTIETVLSGMDGGRVLDVATQEGRFARVLAESLRSYTAIVGIDVNERAIDAAKEATDVDGLSFRVMDAMKLGFEDESFDTVSISASLHHMPDVRKALNEMMRVLKRGGRFLVLEMYRDAETEPEIMAGDLHGWAAEVDSAVGRLHNRQMTRQDILDHVEELTLGGVESHDCLDKSSNPLEQERIEHVEKVVGLITERAAGTRGEDGFRARGEQLLRRVREVGIRTEPLLLVVGEKPI